MAKNSFEEGEGIWRTVGGRHIFIKDGEDIETAMKRSGKFKNTESKEKSKSSKKYTIESYKEKGTDVFDKVPEGYKKLEGATTAPNGYEWYSNGKSRFGGEYKNALVKVSNEETSNKGLKLSDRQKAEGERLNAKGESGARDDIKTYLSGKSNYEGSKEDFIRDVSNEWGVDKEKAQSIYDEESKSKETQITQKKTQSTSNPKDIRRLNELDTKLSEYAAEYDKLNKERSNSPRMSELEDKMESTRNELDKIKKQVGDDKVIANDRVNNTAYILGDEESKKIAFSDIEKANEEAGKRTDKALEKLYGTSDQSRINEIRPYRKEYLEYRKNNRGDKTTWNEYVSKYKEKGEKEPTGTSSKTFEQRYAGTIASMKKETKMSLSEIINFLKKMGNK